MDLLSNLDEKLWENATPENISGLVEYTILKNKSIKPGHFEYALRDNRDEGPLVMAELEGAQGKSNPLHSARQVSMKVEGGKVVAIDIDGDCVVRKS